MPTRDNTLPSAGKLATSPSALQNQSAMKFLLPLLCLLSIGLAFAAEPEFPLTPDSKPQPGIAKGEMVKDNYTAPEDSVFPGTVREYQLYLPAGLDKTQPAAFMVFQDGVIYQAPVVFDNLIAKKDIPPLVGIFIKPGVVPAAHDNALPRFNRSYEYDSITDTYSRFLIEEFLPALEAKHGIKLSTDPNQAAISGNSSGGICAFMTAWHRPDRFRRVFTGVGTYVGIHGADQLPVLVRKIEPKPLRIFLQSGTGDNNLYCGDWWMANQMMERSLTWAGYDVNHAWGEGGHNQKHASQIFPDVLRWLWRDWQTDLVVKANPKGESKWKGYEVVEPSEWILVKNGLSYVSQIAANVHGEVVWFEEDVKNHHISLVRLSLDGTAEKFGDPITLFNLSDFAFGKDDSLYVLCSVKATKDTVVKIDNEGRRSDLPITAKDTLAIAFDSVLNIASLGGQGREWPSGNHLPGSYGYQGQIALSPDQTCVYHLGQGPLIDAWRYGADGSLTLKQSYCELQRGYDGDSRSHGLCVDTEGRLYVATSLGIQVCDQAGRVNFIIPTPMPPLDVCFGGKDLSELFIACGDTIYKRPTKVHGVVSGQQPPIKPAPPKL